MLDLAGCALVVCHPRTIVVAKKEDHIRVEIVPGGIRTTEIGRIEEIQKFAVVHEYWVQSQDGKWYRVSADQFHAAEANRSIDVCQ